ncbi:MAG: hypothetical protein HFH68_13675 [Lachnospiraceae bacterium]|nr:hypothetical protein [Lachnospiraceae bacterium]
MPKILQRTLLISIANYLCYISFYYIASTIVSIALNDKLGFIENRYSSIFFFIFASEFYDTKIPDYIFIAPFSKSERMAMQKKLFLYNHLAAWTITSIVIVSPELIASIINMNIYNFGKSVFVILVIYFLLFTAGHFKYFNLLNRKNYKCTGLLTDTIILIDSSITAAIATETAPGMFTYIIAGAIAISAILDSLYCYKKHFRNMLEFYSDYELRIQNNNYKLFSKTWK